MLLPYSLLAWPPCRLVEVTFECKRDLNASRALLVLECIILKINGFPVQFASANPCRLVEVRVECKMAINASRALLVLERLILKRRKKATTVQFVSVASVQTGRGAC